MALLMSEAAVISTAMEALLYGFSVLMYILTVWILLENRSRRRPNYTLIVSGTTLELLGGVALAVNTARVWQGLVTVGPSSPGGPELYFLDVAHVTFIAKSCLYGIQALILDGVVIFRTYAIWGSALPVILPVLGWCGLLASMIGTNYSCANQKDKLFLGATGEWITSMYSLTLATNLSASVLLAYRIWRVNRDALGYRSSNRRNRLTPVLSAVIESGALYSVTIAIALILFVIGSIGAYILLDMISAIICIVFNMIIIRVAFAANKVPSIMSGSGHHNTTTVRTGPDSRPDGRRRVRAYGSNGHELKSITVQITQDIESDANRNTFIEEDRKVDSRLGGE